MKQYYVKLKSMDTYLNKKGTTGNNVIWIDELKQPFTKIELSEFMNGSIYKQKENLPFKWTDSDYVLKHVLGWQFNTETNLWEWVNPIVELVPTY